MMSKCEGLRVIVTGGSSGIGAAIAEELAVSGAAVTAIGRNEAALLKLKSHLDTSHTVELDIEVLDVTDQASVKAFFQGYLKTHQGLDVLVNCAGQMPVGPLGMTKMEQVNDCFDINVFAMLHCSQLACRLMSRAKNGHIINVSSVLAQQAAAGQSVYAASKAAVESFTKSLSKEFTAQGIRVNCIQPGMVDTPLLDSLSEEAKALAVEASPAKRLAEPREIAKVVAFLLSDSASYINGSVLPVHGGMLV